LESDLTVLRQAIVIAVGRLSQWGKIKANLEQEVSVCVCVGCRSRSTSSCPQERPTPLQQKLEDMVTIIGYFGIAAAALTFLATFIYIAVT
jgi:magnesium-transporting ATPase (P-type)